MLLRRGVRFLVAVAVGLEVVDELEVDPAGDPVPVQIVDDDVLLEDALIVAAPGEERHIAPAPGAKLRQRLRKAHAGGQALAVEAGEFFDLVVHTLEVHGLDIDLKFFAGGHVLVELHRADLDDLAAQVNGQLVEYGGFGTHRLIPFQIQNDIFHTFLHILMSGSKAPDFDAYGLLRATHSHNPTQYSHIVGLSSHFYAHIGAGPKVFHPPMSKLMWA